MSGDLTRLPTYARDGSLHMIVESPRGSSVKIDFDPEHGVFEVSRELPVGVAYPFDWGFIPGTRGDDGDPLDVMALHHQPTYPGVLLHCRLLGMVEVTQREGKGRPQVNNRIIVTPGWSQALGTLERASAIPRLACKQIEQFFVAAVAFTGKRVDIRGWSGKRRTDAFIRERMLSRA
jgi:inorganic pyrophosphatase